MINSYQSHVLTYLWKPFTYATCGCIEYCQTICDPCEIHFMLLRSRSCRLHICFHSWVFQILVFIAVVLSRFTYLTTHMLTSTMEVTQKTCLPFTKNAPSLWHHSSYCKKNMGYTKEKTEKKYPCPRSMGKKKKKKREKKDSSYPK